MEASATTQISRLQKASLTELQAAYEEAFGKPTKSRNRKQLFSQIARKVQDERSGGKLEAKDGKPVITAKFEPRKQAGKKTGRKAGKSKARTSAKKSNRKQAAAKRTAAKKTKSAKQPGQRDPRLPKVGTIINREYKGRTLQVKVLEKGFEYEGQVYRSLSGLARQITGQIINGFLFFRLTRQGSN